MKTKIDYRRYVDMKSEAFAGKSSEDIERMLTLDARYQVFIEYIMERLDK